MRFASAFDIWMQTWEQIDFLDKRMQLILLSWSQMFLCACFSLAVLGENSQVTFAHLETGEL